MGTRNLSESLNDLKALANQIQEEAQGAPDVLNKVQEAMKSLYQDDYIDEYPPINLWEVGDSFRVALCITNAEGRIIYMNRSFALDIGQPSIAACLGRREASLVPSPISDAVITSSKIVAFSLYRPEGAVVVTGIPLFDKKNNLKYVGITMENENAIRETNRSLKMLDGQKDSIQFNKDDSSVIFQSLLGRNKSIVEIRDFILRISPINATVLITAESGCGKEVVADCIYKTGNRRHKPYVKINCAAIPANLLESELFGYEQGSFTGASTKGKIGLLERANEGTVLLDEIGDFPLELQPKLLRFLQHGEVYRIGSTIPHKLDVRIIAATNCNLRQKMKEGKFREDLFYRLNVIPIQVPPLRERVEDIFMLAKYFLGFYCEKYSRNILLSDELMRLLEKHTWPGNIRELQNVMEYYVACSPNEYGLPLEQMKRMLFGTELVETGSTLFELRDNYEKHLIEMAMASAPSLRQAAINLGVYPSSLYRKAQKYNIPVSASDADVLKNT